jgi:itaconyl-CoA hydratase
VTGDADRAQASPDAEEPTASVPRQFGYFYEDFEIGLHFRHPLGRTVTETDNTWFTLLTMNTNQLHFNSHYAAHSPHSRQIVNSGFAIALLLGISVSDISQHAFANLGMTQIKLSSPLFVGDTLYGESVITQVRPSRSRPWAGIVGCFTRGLNQHGQDILSFHRSAMIYRRNAPQRPDDFPQPLTRLDLRLAEQVDEE